MELILPFFKKNRIQILGGIFCMVAVDLAQLAIPQIVKEAVDTLAAGSLQGRDLALQSLLILGIGLVMALLRYGWRMLLMGSARDLERGIRDQLYRHILSLDLSFFDTTKTGDIMAHATSDINHVRMAFGFGLIVLVDTLLLGGACIAIMAATHPKLTALTLIPMPFLVLATKVLGKKMHLFHRTAQEAFSLLTEQIREGFFGIRVIKVFNFEPRILSRVSTASEDYFRKNLKRAFVSALLRPMLGFFFNLSTLVIILYGGFLTLEKDLSPGELVAFLQYFGILAWPVIAIGWMTNLFQRGLASLNRIQDLLKAASAITLPKAPKPACPGRIDLEALHFSYLPGNRVIDGISAEIRPGMRLGITGPPGAGKTSLLQLIPRLYDPDQGSVCLSGTDLRQMDPEALRAQIALMPQEPFLFSGTLKENILMGQPLDQNAFDRVIAICALKETVAQMPQGADTLVGERGVTLSGGQKQRVALARTLLTNRPILLLDDPVSQLDTRTAAQVISNLDHHCKGATLVLVSHRISALAGCDEIWVMEGGKITARGSHAQLREQNPFFREAFRVQQFEEESHD